MCLICIEFQKQLITLSEARRNLVEIRGSLTPEHVEKIERMLNKAEEDLVEEAHP